MADLLAPRAAIRRVRQRSCRLLLRHSDIKTTRWSNDVEQDGDEVAAELWAT